jgi:hypothetical protein
MGGSNDEQNLVNLTAREHFIAHQLLVKMYPDNHKLIHAAHMMSNLQKCKKAGNSRKYEELRRLHADAVSVRHKGKTLSEEHKAKVSAARKGKKLTEKHKAKIGLAGLGKKRSEETKAKMSAAMKGIPKTKEQISKMVATRAKKPVRLRSEDNGMFGKKHSEESREKIRSKMLGRKYSSTQAANHKAAMKQRNQKGEKNPCFRPLTEDEVMVIQQYPDWQTRPAGTINCRLVGSGFAGISSARIKRLQQMY